MSSSCSSYRPNFGPDSVQECTDNINSTHEDFLREDDLNKKADALRYMQAYAMQFLSLVPHEKKFIFPETERVLHQSAMNINDFDPREASVAFEFLGKYAQNILDQPWRKDFHTIKLTSGFYVHNINAQLSNAHEVLVAMGYVHVDEVTLKVVPKLDEKKIKNASRDMIVASQECLILSQIWQRVADQEPDYPLTTGEVFEFRRKYLGDTDTICKAMLMDIRRRNFEHKMHRSSAKNNFVPVDKLIDYEERMDIDTGGSGLDEGDLVEKVRENTRLLHLQKPTTREEHIYDPVYPGDRAVVSMANGGSSIYNNRNFPLFPHRGTSAFVPLIPEINNKPHVSRESLNSPLIPQTVANFVPKSSAGRRSELSRNGGGQSQALQFSKISAEDMAWVENRERHLQGERRKSEIAAAGAPSTTTLNYSEWLSGGSSSSEHHQPAPPPHRRRYSERPPPPVDQSSSSSNLQYLTQGQGQSQGQGGGGGGGDSRSRKPIMPNDVYPDDYFPRVVKPTPRQANHRAGYPVSSPQEESGGEDLINEALAYQSKVNGSSGARAGIRGTNLNHHHHSSEISSAATSRMIKSDWETDTRSISSGYSRYSDNENNKRSPSSPEVTGADWGEDTTGRRELPHMSQAARNSISKAMSGSSSSSSSSGRAPVESREPSAPPPPNYHSSHSHPRSPLGNPTSTGINTTTLTDDTFQAAYYQKILETQLAAGRNQILDRDRDRAPDKVSSSTMTTPPPDVELDPNLNSIIAPPTGTKPSPPEKQIVPPWNCRFCTFRNKRADRICEVCSKSRDFVDEDEDDVGKEEEKLKSAPEVVPKLYSQVKTSPVEGGDMIQCPQCTLLNPRIKFECEACSYRLRNLNNSSPKTYV